MSRILFHGGSIVSSEFAEAQRGDLLIEGERISKVGDFSVSDASVQRVDCSGKLLFPGLVDMHVHITSTPYSHAMLARAGVTSALDLGSRPEAMLQSLAKHGVGLNLGFLHTLVPGETVSGPNPGPEELEKCIDLALSQGAMGIKIIGGHRPMSAESIRSCIALCAQRRCWIAHHSGSVETPGNFYGFEESFQLAEGNPLHIAHINSYCRGDSGLQPLEEAHRAIELLKAHPNCRSESYLALINGTSGRCANDVPLSLVTCRCLRRRGYECSRKGIEKAIQDGWAKVRANDEERRLVYLMSPEEGLRRYREADSNVGISFEVNQPASSIPLAIAKDQDGAFVVDALSTDGGGHPRNLTFKLALCLVEFGALTLGELAYKGAEKPAQLMGLNERGSLQPGKMADIAIVEALSKEVWRTYAAGQMVFDGQQACGQGGTLFTHAENPQTDFPSYSVKPAWLEGGK
ncbi:MAG: amidohydrolase family protein [Lentisphaeria bacterium]|nr:amidohydrolase family protein [Lentisphaeria bacterium]